MGCFYIEFNCWIFFLWGFDNKQGVVCMELILQIVLRIGFILVGLIPFLLLLAVIAMFVDRGKRPVKQDSQEQEGNTEGEIHALVKGTMMMTSEEFKHVWENGKRESVTGVYILHNMSKNSHFIGQSNKALHAVYDHFTGRGDTTVYRDYKNGDVWTVRIVRLVDSPYDNLDALEDYVVNLFGGYKVDGAVTQKQNRGRSTRL